MHDDPRNHALSPASNEQRELIPGPTPRQAKREVSANPPTRVESSASVSHPRLTIQRVEWDRPKGRSNAIQSREPGKTRVRPSHPDPLTQSLTLLATIAVMLLAARFVVPLSLIHI